MNDQHKTKAQLVDELEQTRNRMAKLKYKRSKEALYNLFEIIQFTEHVSTKMHGQVNEAEIYRTVKEEFTLSKQYTTSILLLANDGSSLRIAESSLSSAKVKTGEKATGLQMKGYKIDLKRSSIYRQVVSEGKTVQVCVSDIIGELFPQPLAHLVSKTLGYEKKLCILTPLKRHGKIIGALAMTSPELTEHFIPSVKNLAQHISNVLEWADEYSECKRARAEIEATQEQLRNLSRHLQTVREEDRAMLAREIHDELSQALTALKLGIVELKNTLPADQISLVEKATSMAEYVDTIAQTVNRIATQLRPALLDELGLVDAIEWEIEQFKNRTGIKCELTVEPEEMVIDQDRATAIYRVVQEALTNIARHAQATRSAVTLKMSGDKLHLSITDNGIGIAEDQVLNPKSLGIIGMRERVLSVGGNLKINRIKKKGTKIMVIIPVENES